MPIQIKELIIRATVGDGPNEENTQAAAKDGGNGDGMDQERIVKRCVEEVLEVLRIQNER